MRAINLSHYKIKLRDVSRELYLKHGWEMPRGLQDRALRDPLTFTRQEWQQASRAGLNPKELKAVFQQAWRASDNRAAFEQALKALGFSLARGDRRGFVAVDYRGEVYAVARYAGFKTKEVEAKLGDPAALRPVDEVKIEIASGITTKLQVFIKEVERDAARRSAFIAFRKAELVGRHQEERKRLAEGLERRWQAETKARAARLPRGFSGLWHRLTGQYQKIRAQNEREALEALHRDRAEKDALVFHQLEERQALQRHIEVQRAAAQEELLRLREDVARYQALDREQPVRERKRERDTDDDDGPDNAPRAPRQRQSRRGLDS